MSEGRRLAQAIVNGCTKPLGRAAVVKNAIEAFGRASRRQACVFTTDQMEEEELEAIARAEALEEGYNVPEGEEI